MLKNAAPANATPLPDEFRTVRNLEINTVLDLLGSKSETVSNLRVSKPLTVSDLPAWVASIGRTAADVAALMFRLPMAPEFRPVFEDTIRREVAAELLNLPAVADGECRRMEDIAWLAFDRRLALHAMNLQIRKKLTAAKKKPGASCEAPGLRSRDGRDRTPQRLPEIDAVFCPYPYERRANVMFILRTRQRSLSRWLAGWSPVTVRLPPERSGPHA